MLFRSDEHRIVGASWSGGDSLRGGMGELIASAYDEIAEGRKQPWEMERRRQEHASSIPLPVRWRRRFLAARARCRSMR